MMRCTLGRTRCGGGAAARGRRRPGGAGEIEEVRAFGVVEAEAAGERIEHAFGDAAQVAAFHLGVVVDADAGEHRGFLAAQPGDAAGAAEDRQAGLLRRELRSARGEELADLVLGVHGIERRSDSPGLGGSASTWISRNSHLRAIGALLVVMTEKQTWIITGAGRGLGVDIAKAALAAGHNVVATGRNPDTVTRALGDAEDLLVLALDVTDPEQIASGGRGDARALRHHRRAGQQRGQLLRGLLRGAHAGADAAPARRQPARPDERHPRGPARDARAALRARHHDLLLGRVRRL